MAQGELGVDAVFERLEPQLLQPVRLGVRRGRIVDVRERLPAP